MRRDENSVYYYCISSSLSTFTTEEWKRCWYADTFARSKKNPYKRAHALWHKMKSYWESFFRTRKLYFYLDEEHFFLVEYYNNIIVKVRWYKNWSDLKKREHKIQRYLFLWAKKVKQLLKVSFTIKKGSTDHHQHPPTSKRINKQTKIRWVWVRTEQW